MGTHIAERLERVARRHIEAAIGPEIAGQLAAKDFRDLVTIYRNWRTRFPVQRPRRVHLAREFRRELGRLPNAEAIEAVLADIKVGADLTPYLSDRVHTIHVPPAERKGRGLDEDVDVMLAHDGLHHLHLVKRVPGEHGRRGNDLLFIAFRPDDAYVVGLYEHGAWGRRELLARIVRNWRKAELLRESRVATDLTQHYDDAQRWELMRAGVTVAIKIDGRVYSVPGQTLAHGSSDTAHEVMFLVAAVDVLRAHGVAAFVGTRGGDPTEYWIPAVRDGWLGLASGDAFVAVGQL